MKNPDTAVFAGVPAQRVATSAGATVIAPSQSGSVTATDRLSVLRTHAGESGYFRWDLETGDMSWAAEVGELLEIYARGARPSSAFMTRFDVDARQWLREAAHRATWGRQSAATMPVRTPSGIERIVRVTLFPIPHANVEDISETLVMGTVQDVTREERRYARLYDESQLLETIEDVGEVGSFVLENGRVHWSEQMRRILGIRPDESAEDLRFRDFVHPNDVAAYDAVQAHWKETGRPRTDVTLRIVARTGREAYINIKSVGDVDKNGPKLRGVIVDVTSRVRAAQQIASSQRVESLGRLASEVAHEFNNLLTILMVNISMMGDERSPARRDIDQAMAMGRKLTKQLMMAGRISSLEREVDDLRTIVRSGYYLTKCVAPANVEYIYDESEEPLWIELDPAQIHQTLLNLVCNAVSAMPDGGTVTVSTSLASLPADAPPEAKHGQYALLRVRDTGCGMSKELSNRIFDPYYSTKDTERGTGLGLSIVHGCVRELGGFILVDSQPGDGTTMELYFPLAERKAIPASPVAEPLPAPVERADVVEDVLVVEDDEHIRSFYARGLPQIDGRALHISPSGAHALELAAQLPNLRLLVTDVAMPGMSGIELAQKLTAKYPSVGVLYVTGYAEAYIRERDGDGEFRFLPKPFALADLQDAIAECLAQARAKTDSVPLKSA